MKYALFAVMFATAFLISGCSVKLSPSAVQERGLTPDHSGINRIGVGNAMYSEHDYRSAYGAEMLRRSHRIARGTVFPAYEDAQGEIAYCARPYCFIDTNNDGTFDHFSPFDGDVRDSDFNPTRKPLPYKKVTLRDTDFKGFKKEFIFENYQDGMITIAYTEFTTNLYAPSNKQSVSFKLETLPFTLSFKEMNFEILSVDADVLTYRVLP